MNCPFDLLALLEGHSQISTEATADFVGKGGDLTPQRAEPIARDIRYNRLRGPDIYF
jgi:hypothetical protein